MNTTSSDNFYLLLELFLDPPEEKWTAVEARINEKKNEWNKKRNNPDGLIYQRLSERVEEMRTALSDAKRRKSEGATARAAALRQLDEQIALRSGETIAPEQVDALVKEFKIFFSEATIRSRVKVPICDAAPTRRVPDPPTKPQDDSTIPRFDASKLREVKNCLVTLGKKTIYEALRVAGTSSPSRLQEAADEAVKKARVAANKTSEINALGVLGGLAKEFFKDAKAKKGFEASWANFQFEEKLKPVFTGRIVRKKENGKDVNFVTEENYARSLREATEEGMTPQVAEWFVYDFYVNKRKCPDPRSGDVGATFAEKINCPNCFRQNDKSASRCVECGYALQTKCPKCGVASVLSEFCPTCGFSFGDMANSELAIQNAKEALGRGDFDAASREWNKAKVYWAENPDLQGVAAQLRDFFAQRQFEKFEAELAADRVDEALKLRQNFSFDGGTSPLIEELKRRADSRLQEAASRRRDDYARKQFEKFERALDDGRIDEAIKLHCNFSFDGGTSPLIEELQRRADDRLNDEEDFWELLQNIVELERENRYVEADERLAKLPRKLALRSKVVEKKEEIARVLQRMNDELNAALRVHDVVAKERKINELIALYPDFQRAKDELESLPPVAPNGARASVSDEGIALEWNQRSTRGVSCYRIARFCADGDVNDEGTVVCENCEEREFLDATAEEFKRYYYEVVAVNLDGCASCAAQSEVVVRVGKARDIKVETESRKVAVTWNVSPNVDEIKVYRKNLTNPSGESVRVEPVGVDGFSDAGLENYVEYEYEVTLSYRNAKGELETKEPQRFKVVALDKIDDLNCEYKDGKIEVSWPEPSDGSEAFLWVTSKPSRLQIGQVTRATCQMVSKHLNAQPEKIQGSELTDFGRRIVKIDAKRRNQKAYVLLAMKNGKFLTICAEKSVYCLKPAVNFYAQYTSNDSVYFSWDWPDNVNEVVIYENNNEPPREENYSKCKRYLLTKAEYLKESAWRRSISGKGLVYYRLHLVYDLNGKKVVSPGLDFRNRRSFIEYEKIADDTLQFTTDDVNYYIPSVCVVRRWGRPPYRRDDGDIILTIQPSRGARTKLLPLSEHCEEASHSDKPPYYRCYFTDYADTLNFVLLDPPSAQLKWPTCESRVVRNIASPTAPPHNDDSPALVQEKETDGSEPNSKNSVKKSIWRRLLGGKSR